MINVKRTIIGGAILYTVLLISALILIEISEGLFLTLAIMIVPIIPFTVSKFHYFKNEKSKELMLEGLLVGLVWMFITFIGDIIFVVYAFGEGWSMFKDWEIYVIYLEIVGFTILGGIQNNKGDVNMINK